VENVEEFMLNPYVIVVANASVAMLSIIFLLAIFELVTKYKNWQEIKKGNIAVALATGGKVFGIANIFRFSILQHDTLFQTIVWGMFGFALLLCAYFIFEFLTPSFKVDEEIEKDNRAVGLLAACISVGLSFVIGASISMF
jgi:putative membrane protein